MKKTILTLLLLGCLYGTVASGSSVWLLNPKNCGQWLNARKNQVNHLETIAVYEWVNGYLSALNASGLYGKNTLAKGKTNTQIDFWLDGYCQKNPFAELETATTELMKELQKK